MNLKLFCKPSKGRILSRGATKTILVMKLTVLLFAISMQVCASGVAQKVSLFVKEAPIAKVFQEIKKQTGYSFLWDEKTIRQTKPVTISINNVSIKEALDACVDGQPISYNIMDKLIVISYKNTPRLIPPPTPKLIVVAPIALDVSGTVSDENGLQLKGVSVLNNKTSVGTVTDELGRFTIKASIGDLLSFSFVGYESAEYRVRASGNNAISITLKIKENKLDETVVIGYGTARRRDLTGSVSSVSTKEIKNVPFTTIDNALTGKATGVQVVQADGTPGGVAKIRIRGGASMLGGNDPLYIIDGVHVTVQNKFVSNPGTLPNSLQWNSYLSSADANDGVSGSVARALNSLAGLNINDIESIDILKDASATAIYGSKAANGVVIITTKMGTANQKPILEANIYTGITKPLKEELLNADQYKTFLKNAARNTQEALVANGYDEDYHNTVAVLNDPNYFGTANTDWLGLVLRNGTNQNAEISVRGGGVNTRYYTSISYNNQKGTLIGTDFNRIAGKIGLDNNLSKKARVIVNLDYGYSVNNISNGTYQSALLAPPTESPYLADGSYNPMQDTRFFSVMQNPLAVSTATNRSKTLSLLGSLAFEYNLLKDLKFRSVASLNYTDYRQRNYVPSYVFLGGFYGNEPSNDGLGSMANRILTDAFYENTLTWNKEFNTNNRINLLVGTSWEKISSSYFSATGSGYPDDVNLNNLENATIPVSVKGSDPYDQNALLSFYLRANYSFKEKYLLTFTGRSDASSKFAPANQTGYFPSGAVAWRISQEKFLEKVKWIDEIKLRYSIGKTGTQNIGSNLWRSLYGTGTYAGSTALVPVQIGNLGIKWESTLQQDLGLDFAFFNSRLNGTIGLYNKITDGVLLNVSAAPSSGASNIIYNIAKIRNKGIEFDIRYDVIRGKAFGWNTSLNISSNKSKVLNIAGGPFSDPNDRNSISLSNFIVQEGSELGLLYGVKTVGIAKTQADIDSYKQRYFLWQYLAQTLGVGDMMYETNADSINFKKSVLGTTAPKFWGGFTNTFTYKNLSLTGLLTYSYGNRLIYDMALMDGYINTLANKTTRALENTRPIKFSTPTPYDLSDEYVFDASYIKLRSLTLGYELPKSLINKIKFNNAIFYVTGTNLLTLTKYPGADPEVSDDPYSIIGGARDAGTYPSSRGVVVGLRFAF